MEKIASAYPRKKVASSCLEECARDSLNRFIEVLVRMDRNHGKQKKADQPTGKNQMSKQDGCSGAAVEGAELLKDFRIPRERLREIADAKLREMISRKNKAN